MVHQTESDVRDAEDMERLVSGQDSGLDALMERHRERLFHYLLRQLQNEAEASDLAQETFVRVYLHRTKFNPRLKFSTWLYTIATNLVRDRFRWRTRHRHVSLDAEASSPQQTYHQAIPDSRPLPSELMQQSERAEAVRVAVSALPEEWRTPLLLAEFQGQPQAEIAKILKCSIKAVEMRLYRARAELRKRLEHLVTAESGENP